MILLSILVRSKGNHIKAKLISLLNFQNRKVKPKNLNLNLSDAVSQSGVGYICLLVNLMLKIIPKIY